MFLGQHGTVAQCGKSQTRAGKCGQISKPSLNANPGHVKQWLGIRGVHAQNIEQVVRAVDGAVASVTHLIVAADNC